MDTIVPPLTDTTPTTQPPATRLRHIFRRGDATFARELGIDVPMLCGAWGPPSRTATGHPMTTSDLAPDNCPTCAALLADRIHLRALGIDPDTGANITTGVTA